MDSFVVLFLVWWIFLVITRSVDSLPRLTISGLLAFPCLCFQIQRCRGCQSICVATLVRHQPGLTLPDFMSDSRPAVRAEGQDRLLEPPQAPGEHGMCFSVGWRMLCPVGFVDLDAGTPLTEVTMKTISIEMPLVAQCSVSECAYNTENCCHARAITVGDSIHPGCDTFMESASHSKARQRTAGVGACKVSACQHNDDYECMAEQISVGHANNAVNCLTYSHR